jgi:hypothetical protein
MEGFWQNPKLLVVVVLHVAGQRHLEHNHHSANSDE